MKGKWAIAIGLVLSMVLIPSALAGASQTIVVEPTGADDTANIQAACDTVGLGGVVELTAGHFSLSRPIVVRNWSGTVRGQGKDKTILHTSADEFPRVPLGTPLGDWSVAGMLMFMYDDGAVGELHVQGLGFRPTGLSTPDPDYGDLDIQPILVATWKDGAVAHVDSTWRDLRIQGDRSSGHPEGINVKYGLGLLQVPGTHVISDVDFDTSFGVGIVANFLSSGKLIVGGPHAGDRVTFTDMGFGGVYGFTDSNMEIDVSNVQARNVGTAFAMYELDNCRVHMWDVETVNGSGAATGPCAVGCAARLSTYLFEHNVIRQQPESLWAGFEIWQDWDVKSNIVIRNNKISGQGSYLWGPIFTLGARNVVIANNTITGSGPAAMYLGAWGADDSGLMVKGNNVQGWKVDSGPCGAVCQDLPLAPIWLGIETSGITVVGSGNLRTNVFDETDNPATPAYDGANILVGVNNRGAHIGQAIRDAMQRRIEAKKLFMSKRPF